MGGASLSDRDGRRNGRLGAGDGAADPAPGQCCGHGLGADLLSAGVRHDRARSRAVLWGTRAKQERAGHDHAQFRHPVPGQLALDPVRIQLGLWSGSQRGDRRARVGRAERRRHGPPSDLRSDHSTPGVHGVSTHVRGDHAGLNHRGLRRTDEVQRAAVVQCPLVPADLLPGSALDLGWRLAGQAGGPGFRRGSRRAHQLWRQCPSLRDGARSASRLWDRVHGASQPAVDAAGDRTAVVWLVRIQCGKRAGREPDGGGSVCGDPYGRGDSRLNLAAGGMVAPGHAHGAGGGQRRGGRLGDSYPRSRLCRAVFSRADRVPGWFLVLSGHHLEGEARL